MINNEYSSDIPFILPYILWYIFRVYMIIFLDNYNPLFQYIYIYDHSLFIQWHILSSTRVCQAMRWKQRRMWSGQPYRPTPRCAERNCGKPLWFIWTWWKIPMFLALDPVVSQCFSSSGCQTATFMLHLQTYPDVMMYIELKGWN